MSTHAIAPNQPPIFVDLSDLPSMDDLLGEDKSADYGEGKILTGKIVEKRDSGVVVDFGYKAEGIIPREEYEDFTLIEVGQEARAMLVTLEDEEYGMPLLSIERAIQQDRWDKFVKENVEGAVLTGNAKYRVKGGLIVDVGVDAFLPGSQVDLGPVRNLDELVGH